MYKGTKPSIKDGQSMRSMQSLAADIVKSDNEYQLREIRTHMSSLSMPGAYPLRIFGIPLRQQGALIITTYLGPIALTAICSRIDAADQLKEMGKG